MIESAHNTNSMENLLASLSTSIDYSSRRLKTTKKSIKGILDFLSLPTKQYLVEPRTIEHEEKDQLGNITIRTEKIDGIINDTLLQYDKVHQHKLSEWTLNIEHDLAGVIPIAMNLRTTYYNLEKHEPTPQQPGVPPLPQMTFQQQNPSALSKLGTFFGKKATTINDLQSPYHMAMEPIQAIENIEQIYRKWIDYHTYGVIRSMHQSKATMGLYLTVETKYFIDIVSPAIMKVVGEAQRIFTEKEQSLITSVVGQGIKSAEAANAFGG